MAMARACTVLFAAAILLIYLSAAGAASLAGAFPALSQAAEEGESASVKQYYSQGETSDICLKQTTIKACDVVGLLAAVRYE